MRELNNELDRLRRRTHDANEAFMRAEQAGVELNMAEPVEDVLQRLW